MIQYISIDFEEIYWYSPNITRGERWGPAKGTERRIIERGPAWRLDGGRKLPAPPRDPCGAP